MLWRVSRANPQSVVVSHFHSNSESLTAPEQIAELALAPAVGFGKVLTGDSGRLPFHPTIRLWNASPLGLATGRLVWDSGLLIGHVPPPFDPPHLCLTGNMGPGVPEVLTTMNFSQARAPQLPRWGSGVPWVLGGMKIPLEGEK